MSEAAPYQTQGTAMHGTAIMNVAREKPAILPAIFPLGQCWFAAMVEYGAMQWEEADQKRGAGFVIERAISDELGLETFAPPEQKMAIRRGRKVKLITPALGPYVFIKFDRERDPWGSLSAYDYRNRSGIRGFVELLTNNGFPVRVPDIAIEKLKRAVDLGLFGLSALQPGTDVEIMEGPFAGFIGKIKSATKQRRAKILLKMLGSIEVDPCFLRKI